MKNEKENSEDFANLVNLMSVFAEADMRNGRLKNDAQAAYIDQIDEIKKEFAELQSTLIQAAEPLAPLTGSARPPPKEIAQRAWDNGHVPTFLKSLCELLLCSDPWPASPESETEIKAKADVMARKLGFSDWIEAYHGL